MAPCHAALRPIGPCVLAVQMPVFIICWTYKCSLIVLQDLKAALKVKGMRPNQDRARLDGYMFAHKYLVMEQLQGNNPQALKQQYVAKQKRCRKNSKKQCKR